MAGGRRLQADLGPAGRSHQTLTLTGRTEGAGLWKASSRSGTRTLHSPTNNTCNAQNFPGKVRGLVTRTQTPQAQGLGTRTVFAELPALSRAARSGSSVGSPCRSRHTQAPARRRERTHAAGSRGHELRPGQRVSRAGLRPGGTHGPRGLPAPAARSAAAGGRAGTPGCASESSNPCLGPRPAFAARHPGLFRTPRRRGGAAGDRDGDRCAPRPMAGPEPLPKPPPSAPIGGRAALQVRGGARVPSPAPAASARSPAGCSAEPGSPAPARRALAWEFVRERVNAARGGARTEEAPGPWSPSAEFPAATLITGK